MEATLGHKIIAKLERLKADRQPFEALWQECADYALPQKNNITSKGTPGEKKGEKVVDTTAIQANELLAGALHGMMTNPASLWFDLTSGDPQIDAMDEVRHYLQIAAHKMHGVINNSNFQTEVHELYLDQGVFGTSPMSIEEDDDMVVCFNARPIAEVYIDENHKGLVDTVYRVFEWTARQILQRFGKENCPKSVMEALEKDPMTKFELVHAVEPRSEYDVLRGPKGYPIASCYVLCKDKHVLSESGFKTFPYVVPRWSKISGEKYGRSPTQKALADIKMVNAMMKATLKAAQKTVDPPMMAPDDGFLLPLKLTPGGLNFYRAGTQDKLEPLFTGAKVDFGYQVVEDVRKRIRECYYVDQLQLAQGPQMTATEVLQRTEEKLRLMGPMLGRMQFEFLVPLIDRVFEIMEERGLLPQAPTVLEGRVVQTKFSSQVAKAQRASEAQNIMRTIELVSPFAQMNPAVMDNFDGDKAARYIATMQGLPESIMRDQDKVEELREGRAQALEEQREMEQNAATADVIGKVAPAAVQAKQAGVL